jgi:hypothetical protein
MMLMLYMLVNFLDQVRHIFKYKEDTFYLKQKKKDFTFLMHILQDHLVHFHFGLCQDRARPNIYQIIISHSRFS